MSCPAFGRVDSADCADKNAPQMPPIAQMRMNVFRVGPAAGRNAAEHERGFAARRVGSSLRSSA